MKLHTLKPAEGSTHSQRRIGRGPGSGLGGTSTRGHKGAKARSGYKKKIGFEGGQMPLQRRVPKSGFKNINHKEYFAVNLSTIQKIAEEKKNEYNDLFCNPYQAAKMGYIDDIIEPRNTRFRVIRALESLAGKKQSIPAKKHDNLPL